MEKTLSNKLSNEEYEALIAKTFEGTLVKENTIVTGKIGFGVGGSNFATIIGVRPWPSTAYLQFSFNQRSNFSIEVVVPELYGEGFIITYGIRF